MRERSGRQDVPQRSGPNGLARRASAANATNESGGEAEIAGEVRGRGGAATRSLRSTRGAAHSGVSRIPSEMLGGFLLGSESRGVDKFGLTLHGGI
jgi:hypothetical protein